MCFYRRPIRTRDFTVTHFLWFYLITRLVFSLMVPVIYIPLFQHLWIQDINKGNSDWKACLDYCEDLAKSCQNLNFCFPVQTEPFYWLRSQFSCFFDFSQHHVIQTNGRENSNDYNFLQDLRNNPLTFPKSLGLYISLWSFIL